MRATVVIGGVDAVDGDFAAEAGTSSGRTSLGGARTGELALEEGAIVEQRLPTGVTALGGHAEKRAYISSI